MCDNCKCNEELEVKESEDQETLQIELQEGYEVQEYMFDPITIEIEDYNQDEFSKGIKNGSYVAGLITSLKNAGLTFEQCMEYVLNEQTIKFNLEATRMNVEMNIEMSKNQASQVDKNSL